MPFELQPGEDSYVREQADLLGLSPDTLLAMGAGWDGEAMAIPMFDAGLSVVGIRRRFPDGRKLAVTGGHEGVFMVPPSSDGDLVVCEGFSDCAAVIGLGVLAVGEERVLVPGQALVRGTGPMPVVEASCEAKPH